MTKPLPIPLAKLGAVETEARTHLETYAFSGAYVLRLLATIRELEADRNHWRSNHASAVRRKRVADEYKEDFRCRALAAEERAGELAELETASRALVASLGEYVRQSMHASPEWRDGIAAIETVLLRLAQQRLSPAESPELEPALVDNPNPRRS